MLKNKIILKDDNYYLVERTNPDTMLLCRRWFEKKSGHYHIVLPKDNSTGRTFIREKLIVNGSYEFDDKTTGPRTLGSSWKNQLTKEESQKLEKLEKTIEESNKEIDKLKELGRSRIPVKISPTTKKELEKTIEELKKELEQLRKSK